MRDSLLRPALAAALLLAGCAVAPPGDAGGSLAVYRAAGSTQCEGGGATRAEMAAALTRAGVRVLSSACGSDGQMRIALCGAPDGRISIFVIPAAQAATAAALGYAPLDRLPQAIELPCAP